MGKVHTGIGRRRSVACEMSFDTHHHRGVRCQSNRVIQSIGQGDQDSCPIDDDDEGNTMDATNSWGPGKEYIEARI